MNEPQDREISNDLHDRQFVSSLRSENISKKRPKNTTIKSAELSQLDWKKFKVMSKLAKRSIASNAQSALTSYVRKFWHEYEQILIYEASQQSVSPEELFNQLADDKE